MHIDPTARKCGSGTQDPTIMIAVTGKKRGAEVAEIEKLKASRVECKRGCPQPGSGGAS